jgi:hypothetical protein
VRQLKEDNVTLEEDKSSNDTDKVLPLEKLILADVFLAAAAVNISDKFEGYALYTIRICEDLSGWQKFMEMMDQVLEIMVWGDRYVPYCEFREKWKLLEAKHQIYVYNTDWAQEVRWDWRENAYQLGLAAASPERQKSMQLERKKYEMENPFQQNRLRSCANKPTLHVIIYFHCICYIIMYMY